MQFKKRYASLNGAGSRLTRTYIGDEVGLPKSLSPEHSFYHEDSKFLVDRIGKRNAALWHNKRVPNVVDGILPVLHHLIALTLSRVSL